MGLIRVGTCAWADHTGFYPPGLRPGDRLAHYARFFDLVEIDTTFYAPPDPARVRRWVRAVPPGFTFNMKAHRSTTGHDRTPLPPEEAERAVLLQKEALRILAGEGKLGCLLFQFPPWVRGDEAGTALVERAVRTFEGVLWAVEFRHRSWFGPGRAEETLGWLASMGAVHVVADEPQVADAAVPLVPRVTTPRLSVMRLHGRNRATWLAPGLRSSQDRFDYLYGPEELRGLAETALTLQEGAREVHVLTNNNRANYAVENALQLKGLLTRDPLPPTTLF